MMVCCRSKIGSLAIIVFVIIDVVITSRFQTLGVNGLAASQQRPRRPPRPPNLRNLGKPSSSPNSPTFSSSQLDDDNSNRSIRTTSRHEQALQDPTLLSDTLFSERRDDFHPLTLRALTEGMGLQTMTNIQARTFGPALEGISIMARSRTGSGKTLAFLLPSLERLLKQDLDLYRPGRSIGMVVLSPTRELAIQIADQAEQLLQYHPKAEGLSVACLYGGVKMQRDTRLLTGGTSPHRLPAIVVSTPGRLLDHLEGDTRLGRNDRFADIVRDTKIVVLDETDRLWENHQKEVKKILSFFARSEKRQMLLFSATFSRSIRRLLKASVLKGRDALEVDCLDDGGDKDKERPEITKAAAISERIQQSYVVLDHMSQYIPLLLAIIRREQHKNRDDFKILVFFPTSRVVRFFYQFFTLGDVNMGMGVKNSDDNLWEIHSRMSQSSRSRASNAFRNARTGILLSSDVSARGLDYPDVTMVVQMGTPSKESNYVHRLGRTGRAGRAGRGILVLLPFEDGNNLINLSKGILGKDKKLLAWYEKDQEGIKGGSTESTPSLFRDCHDDLESTRAKIRSGHVILTPSAEAAFKSFLAHYSAMAQYSEGKKDSPLMPTEIMAYAEDFAKALGIVDLPELDEKVATRIGL